MSQETSEAEQLSLDVAAAEKPKRRTRKKVVADEGAAASAEAAPAEEKKPARRGRKPKAEVAAEVSTDVEAAAEKPARKKRVSKRAEKDEAVKPVDEDAKPATDEAAAEKPRRRGRKPKAAQVEAESAAPESNAAVAAIPEVAVAEEAPAKPRRRRRKADAEGGQAEFASVDQMTRATQAATQASSEPTPMPSQVIDAPAGEKPEKSDKPEKPAKADREDRSEKPERKDKSERKEKGDRDKGDRKDGDRGERNARFDRNERRNRNRNRNRRGQDGPSAPSLSREELAEMKVAELRSKAAELGVEYVGVRKPDLIEAIYAAAAKAEGFRTVEGVLEMSNEGYGWVRTGNYMEGDNDAFVHQQLVRSLGLRPGDYITGNVGPGRGNSKYPPLQSVTTVNGGVAENLKSRPRFRDLTPVYPNERLTMECGKDSITGRAIDLVSPIGKGQRGLIVSPPKAGKTTVLKKICQSITSNNPEVHLFCLLVDERPEEVTDMQRSIKGTVVASTFDMPAENHTRVSELVIEHAKRLVEMGQDVVVVLDSITRLARAYNLAQPASGRILSGGVDSAALYPPKKFLGAARNIENGGSLTIIASALVDTGSKMDEVIFEEFKGTGNMELKLDRDLADKRIFPAIDPVSSGTRNEDLLVSPEYQPFVWGIRRVLANMNNVERAANALVKGLKGTDNNKEFLIKSAKKAQQSDYIA